MSEFTTRTIVRCPPGQAQRRLTQYFRAHGNADGDVVRLKLGLDLPRTAPSEESARLGRSVIATFSPSPVPGSMIPHYAVTWSAEGGGPYPVFVGHLFLEPDEDYHCFFLRLTGDYQAPYGMVGSAFDAVVGRKIAKATIATLLLRVADAIERQFECDERAKRRHESLPLAADRVRAPFTTN